INKLELLLENKNLTDYQALELSEIYSITQRMIRLNKSLLLLSKIENKQFIENQIVEIHKIVQQSIEELEDFAAYKNVSIRIKKTNALSVTSNPDLAYIIVSNLLRNAIFHNIEHDFVEVCIT